MQTETLWEITVSESVQGQDFESLQVCFIFFLVGKFEFTCSFEPMMYGDSMLCNGGVFFKQL